MVKTQKVICPELTPEVAVSHGASSTPSLSRKEAQMLSLADAITVSRMKAHEMDASSQKFAMIHWTLCTAYLNGTITQPEFKTELLALVKDGRAAMMIQATTAKDVGVAAAKAVTSNGAASAAKPAAQQQARQ